MSSTAEYDPWSPTGPASKEYPKASKSPVCIHWILLPKKSVALSRLTARTPCWTTAGPCPPWWVDPSPLPRKASFPGFPDFAGVFVGACKFFGLSSFTFGTTWADLEPNTFWVGVFWSPFFKAKQGGEKTPHKIPVWYLGDSWHPACWSCIENRCFVSKAPPLQLWSLQEESQGVQCPPG